MFAKVDLEPETDCWRELKLVVFFLRKNKSDVWGKGLRIFPH